MKPSGNELMDQNRDKRWSEVAKGRGQGVNEVICCYWMLCSQLKGADKMNCHYWGRCCIIDCTRAYIKMQIASLRSLDRL